MVNSQSDATPILEVSGVDKVYATGFWMKPVKVLDAIQLSVPKNSVFGFIGANGAGKTSLIQLIVGVRRPTLGSVKILGYSAESTEARSRVGFLPERPYFYDFLTGEKFLGHLGRLSGLDSGALAERIPEVLKTVGLSEAGGRELKKYSKGMLQRIGIAQAILHAPELLVLDEPMSGLDPAGRKEVRELISQLASDGMTIFFSTHVISDVESVCDQVGVIEKGKMISCGAIGGYLLEETIHTEVAFRGVSDEQLKRIGHLPPWQAIPSAMRVRIQDQSQVQRVIKDLVENNAEILWVNPHRPSLEEKFFK